MVILVVSRDWCQTPSIRPRYAPVQRKTVILFFHPLGNPFKVHCGDPLTFIYYHLQAKTSSCTKHLSKCKGQISMDITEHCHTPQRNFVQFSDCVTFIFWCQNALNFAVVPQSLEDMQLILVSGSCCAHNIFFLFSNSHNIFCAYSYFPHEKHIWTLWFNDLFSRAFWGHTLHFFPPWHQGSQNICIFVTNTYTAGP